MGTITTTLAGVPSGTATATLTQDGSQVRGSLHAIYPVPPNSGGSFSNFVGTASGTFLSAIVTNPAIPNPASCPYRLSLTLYGNLLTGTYESEVFCPVAFTGTFDVKKQ